MLKTITSLNSLSVRKLLDLSHPYFAYICLPLLLPYWALLGLTGPYWALLGLNRALLGLF